MALGLKGSSNTGQGNLGPWEHGADPIQQISFSAILVWHNSNNITQFINHMMII